MERRPMIPIQRRFGAVLMVILSITAAATSGNVQVITGYFAFVFGVILYADYRTRRRWQREEPPWRG